MIKFIVLFLSLLSFSVFAEEKSSDPLAGAKVKYNTVKEEGQEFVFKEDSNTKFEVLYFFSYSCPHCYDFDYFINHWKKFKKDDTTIHYIPVNFREGWEETAKAYIVNEDLKIKDFNEIIFNKIHVKKEKILNQEQLDKFFIEELKVDSDKYSSVYNSLSTKLEYNKYEKMSDDFEVMGTPSIILITDKGKLYQVSPEISDGLFNTIYSLEFLLYKNRKP